MLRGPDGAWRWPAPVVLTMALFDPSRPQVDPLQSPCVRNCCLDEQDVCLGCGRTLAEIRAWSSLSERERQQVLDLCEERKRQRDRFLQSPR